MILYSILSDVYSLLAESTLKLLTNLFLLTFIIAGSSFAVSKEALYSITTAEHSNVIEESELIGNLTNKPFTGDLSEIKKRRILRVLVTHSRTDFFLDGAEIRGAQAELVSEFLKDINKNINRESDKLLVQFLPVEFSQLIPSLLAGEGDIAAAFLTMTPEREQLVDFVSGHSMNVSEILVINKNVTAPESTAGLSGKTVYVLKNSSYTEHLKELNEQLAIVGLPEIDIQEADERLLTEDILELVNAGIVDYSVCDDFKANLWKQVLPNLVPVDDVVISKDMSVGWAIRKNSPELAKALSQFMKRAKKGTFLGNILFSRYFKNTDNIQNPLEEAERQKLLQVIELFKEYGTRFQFDPLALAAQAYQESGLDNNARSHRGAIGIMQMLPSTAKDKSVAIDDIEILENNIHAGAKYLNFLRERYFSSEEIDPMDQRLLTWAAYNAGPGNLIRIRKAAKKHGLDENVWFGNVEVMAARMISREPVRYVANIHKYYTAYTLIMKRTSERQDAMETQMEKL